MPLNGDEPRTRPKGKSAVVVSIADAAREIQRKRKRRDDPPPAKPRNGVAPQQWPGVPQNWSANALGLPVEDPCPVECLGIEGELHHMIDTAGQHRAYAPSDFSHAGMQSLFAALPNWPQWAFPRHGRVGKADKDGKPVPPPIQSFHDDALRTALMLACTRAGLFTPSDRMRGRGAWTQRGGELIYHAGEELWVYDRKKNQPVMKDTGLHEGFLYPRMASLPAPWEEAIADQSNPCGALLETFRLWSWERPTVDPVLMLGWVGVAYLGGALDWRSAVLILGGHGTGKSTLQDGLKSLFGDALFHSADTTAAGIYQRMAHDTRPIAVDELEPGADPRKVEAVVTLMRGASSGAMARRGSQGHQAVEFQLRSTFLFSAINNPLHSPQDLSRVAILRMQSLAAGRTKGPVIDSETTGRRVLALLMREWPRFYETRDLYMAALAAGGHVARGQKTYGTLLAAADVMLGADLAEAYEVPLAWRFGEAGERLRDEAALEWWARELNAATLPEVEDAVPNWRACLDTILGTQVDQWRGGQRSTVGILLRDLATDQLEMPEARRALEMAGLGLLVPGDVAPAADGYVLAIPGKSPLLSRLLQESDWRHGGWKDAIRQCKHEGVVITDKARNRVMIGGSQQRCTLVVMGRFHGTAEGM